MVTTGADEVKGGVEDTRPRQQAHRKVEIGDTILGKKAYTRMKKHVPTKKRLRLDFMMKRGNASLCNLTFDLDMREALRDW